MGDSKNFILNKIKNNKPKPKFNIGDIIYNKKYDIFRKVEEIHNTENYKNSQYRLKDVKNPFRTGNYKISYKYCANIDFTYLKVDIKIAKLLFGVNYEE